MRSVKKLKNIRGKTILIRVDFNLPIKNGKVEDNFRIIKVLPTINFLKGKGAKLVLVSHLGKGAESLAPVAKAMKKFVKVKFVPQVIGPKVKKVTREMRNGEVILLENLRNNPGEQKSDKNFAKKLASFADIYVNEAFPVSHRYDASIVLLPKFLPSYAGFQFEKEIKNLSRVLKNPEHPFLFILGGTKFENKIPLVRKYIQLADYVFVGGALLHNFLKAKGYEIGQSLYKKVDLDLKRIMKSKKLILPGDVVVRTSTGLTKKKINAIKKNETIFDIGPGSVKKIAPFIKNARLILWGGPLGIYEERGGDISTTKILKLVAGSRAQSIIAGGNTVVLVSRLKMEKKFSFVSTGGGATLEFLAKGTLPGIKALQ